MKKILFLLFLTSLTCISYSSHANEASYYWLSSIKKSTQEAAQSVGSYANGCLAGGVMLDHNSPNYQLMRLSRERYYVHSKLFNFITDFAKTVQQTHPFSGIVVGDTGGAIGGPMASGHTSHQTGLDVDIWLRPAFTSRLSFSDRETISAISHVTPQQTIKESWNKDYTNFVLLAAQDSRVSRIFVNPAIKKAICQSVNPEQNIKILSKIRPWYGHDAHMHVRLSCAEKDRLCINQPAPVMQHGCSGHDIDWWYTQEALNPPKPDKPVVQKTFSDLPQVCQKLYEDAKMHSQGL